MNNALRQGTAVGDLRYTTDVATAYLNIAGDEQKLGFPGPRRIDVMFGLNQYVTDPRGTDTPRDYGDTQGWRITAGVTRRLGNGIELILDGGFREKLQQAGFFQPFSEAYVDTTLTTASLTPRVNIRNQLFGMPNNVIAGIDLYRTDYSSDRSFAKGLPVIHQFTGRQDMFAVYGQQTLGVRPTTDVSFGARAQWNKTSLYDVYDPNAPQNATFPQGGPLDQPEWNYAAHLGVQHRVSRDFTLFGRVARSFRVPNVDERIGNGALVFPLQPPTFDLKTQTSHDIEAGVKAEIGRVTVQTSIYQMDLENELHLNPINFANSNLDPTRRRGVETIVTAKLADNLRLKGNLTLTDARFREGPFAGKFVPVVSQWTGNAMLSWDILPKQLVADFVLRYASDRFLDNDEFNRGTYKIPAHTLVDVRLGGQYKNLVWSIAVENLFDEKYFDYGLDTSFTFLGTTFLSYSVYPQPGRTILGKLGVKLP
jgi:iron complex outermembrane receptor protein